MVKSFFAHWLSMLLHCWRIFPKVGSWFQNASSECELNGSKDSICNFQYYSPNNNSFWPHTVKEERKARNDIVRRHYAVGVFEVCASFSLAISKSCIRVSLIHKVRFWDGSQRPELLWCYLILSHSASTFIILNKEFSKETFIKPSHEHQQRAYTRISSYYFEETSGLQSQI